ncbi:MAG: 4Fe-4S dicluster domain-containing protein [Chloracidobacterium sp.]|nr:4Fe-4S dicluster domain-containing protein [Chloracidobacterium sp.]
MGTRLCIQCGNCSFVCPHSVIRSKFYHRDNLAAAPEGFQSAPINAWAFRKQSLLCRFISEDCTGCSFGYEVCPVEDRTTGKRAINIEESQRTCSGACQDRILRGSAGKREDRCQFFDRSLCSVS